MPDLYKSTVDWATLIIDALGVILTVVVALAVYWRTKRSAEKALVYDFTFAGYAKSHCSIFIGQASG
jgi:hypothetical protein